jgi:outer membrane protein, heavy metal efflux system
MPYTIASKRYRHAGLWIAAAALAFPVSTQAQLAAPATDTANATELTLAAVFRRVEQSHPDLRRLDFARTGLQAEARQAAQRPALVLGAEAENVAGTGQAAGIRSAELTLSLASTLERGGKREARQTLAGSRIDAVAIQRETARLDLLAEAARRYLDVVAAQAQAQIAAADLAQRQAASRAAARRVQAGASPQSIALTAEAAQARAAIDQARAQAEAIGAFRRLATLWGATDATPQPALGDPLALPALDAYPTLLRQVEETPMLRQFASEARIREARVQLARSESRADVSWQVGVRRFQDGGDWGLVGSVSIPLGSASRAAPGIQAAEAEAAALAVEKESAQWSLDATLAQAYGQYTADRAEVLGIGKELLPRLTAAGDAAARAYRAGALSYLEWAQVQNDTTAARRQQLAAAIDAQRALIELQRLTGQPVIDAPSTSKDRLP